MKRIISATLAGAAAIAASFGAAAQDLPRTELKIVGGIGITTQYKLLEQPYWSQKIPAASKGAITAEIKPWNEIGLKGPELFRLLQRGVMDGTTGFLGHMAGEIPINDGVDLPGASPNYDTFRAVSTAFRPVLEEYYEKELGLKILGLWSYQAQVLFCRSELKGLADLKGRKVRTSSASQSEFIGYFGGSGIPMSIGEVQDALAKGVIDCAITGTMGGYKAKWVEVAKNVFPLPVNWGSLAFAMNQKKWASLDPRVQAVLKSEIGKLEADIWEQNKAEHQTGLDCSTQGPCPEGPVGGAKLNPVPAQDAELLRKALLDAVLPSWAAKCGAACVAQWNGTVGKTLNLTAVAK
jgi:TRAP-type C4-dicarboxylate transport system substrate-binding protein